MQPTADPSPGLVVVPLAEPADRPRVAEFYARAADYVLLEQGSPPDRGTVDDFFADVPPGLDRSATRTIGLEDATGQLAGLAALAFGFPEAGDCYIGLMILDTRNRGRGAGGVFLRAIEDMARAAGSPRLYLAVLDGNPRARAFWEREGFRVVRSFPPVRIGLRTHVRHRMMKPL